MKKKLKTKTKKKNNEACHQENKKKQQQKSNCPWRFVNGKTHVKMQKKIIQYRHGISKLLQKHKNIYIYI